jgi:DHA2 family multidrug resistance protein
VGTSFFDRRLLKDANFVTGLLFAFIVGMVLYATMALLPTLLQGLLGYPVVYTGIVMAPRGIGTMVAMLLVGRMLHFIDARAIMALGFVLTAIALYMMTTMTLDMGSRIIVVSGVIQGLGIGFTFVPLSAVAFATLAPALRNDGTPIFSLLRNIGSSVGISIVQAMLTSGTARFHAELATDIASGNLAFAALPAAVDPATPAGLRIIDGLVDRQAAMMAYLGDFRFMLVLTVVSLPLLLLIRKARAAPKSPEGAPEPELAHEV